MSHPRGVFEPEFTGPGGHQMFLAIDSKGRVVAHVSVTDPTRRDQVLESFRRLLHQVQPEASLRLIH